MLSSHSDHCPIHFDIGRVGNTIQYSTIQYSSILANINYFTNLDFPKITRILLWSLPFELKSIDQVDVLASPMSNPRKSETWCLENNHFLSEVSLYFGKCNFPSGKVTWEVVILQSFSGVSYPCKRILPNSFPSKTYIRPFNQVGFF